MSYILDALRRADAEREQGQAPGVHTRHALTAPATRAPGRRKRHRAALAATATAIVLAAALIGWFWTRDPASTATPPTAPAIQTTTAPPTLPGAQPAPEAGAAPSQPAARLAAPPPILAPAAPPASPAPAARAGNTPPGPSSPSAPPAAKAGGAAGIVAFTDLSAEQRAALPPVNVTGSTYSERAALRTLIVNGQVLQEGDEIAPGLRLEAIEKQSAVLNHRGLRYRVGL